MSSLADAPLSQRTVRAGLWTVGARLSSRFVDLFALLVLARFLDPADFGLVATAMTIIFIVEAVLELPLTSALVRLSEISQRAYNTAFTLGLLRGIVVAVIMATLSYPLSRFYGDERLVPLICTLALAPAMRGMASPRMVQFEKTMDFRRRGILELLGKTTAAAVAIAIAVATGSYWAIAASTITAPTVMMIVSYVMAPMLPRLTLADWPLFADMVGWNFASQVLAAVNWQIDRILLPRYIDTASFGRFTAANDLASLPFQAIAAPATGPLMAAFVNAKENGSLREAYLKSSSGLVLILMPVLCFMALLSGPVIRVLLGPKWDEAAPILSWLALIGLVVLPSVPMPPLAMVMDKSRALAVRSLVELSVRVPLSLVGVIFFGIPGAIVARLGGSLAMGVSSLTLTKSMAGIGIADQLSVVVRPLMAIVPAALVLYLCKTYLNFDEYLYASFALAGGAYCLTYGASIYLFWVAARRPAGVEASLAGMVSSYIRRR